MTTTLSAVWTIVVKDMRRYVRNGGLLTFGLLLPLCTTLFFNLVLGGGSAEREAAVYAVVDADDGDMGSGFVDDVLAPLEEEGVLRIAEAGSEDEARAMIEDRDARAAFLIPSDFTEALESGQETVLTIVGDANSAMETHIAREIANAYSTEHMRLRLAVAASFEGEPSQEEAQTLMEEAAAAPPPLRVAEEDGVRDRELDTSSYYSASMAYFFVFFAAMLSVTSIFEERSRGTLARLQAAPVPRSAIILGKLAGGLIVGLTSMGVLALATSTVFGADWGHPVGATVLVVTGVIAAIGLTAAVAGFARTGDQAANRVSVLAMLMGVLGGALVPITQLNAFAFLSHLTPHRWFLEGLVGLTSDDLGTVVLACGVLLAIGVTGLSIAMFRMGRMVNS
ncbi:ABC-2 type transport system permease protein [Nocardiopsis sp. Huas11]|uniref:ABC transporter permease n=1 Tax=Nocardiopsis sp. Huas11 TaxID=2183912 RepID=UPI000EB487B4|nr:ABC transporter permease [Nocardiopsis sp. Huas11]RKS06879.1 ABC-2 type transport system permease protein [Nocardiopsis sp. Huas11]